MVCPRFFMDAVDAMLREFVRFHRSNDVACEPGSDLMRAATFLVDANVVCGNTLTGLDWLGEEITLA